MATATEQLGGYVEAFSERLAAGGPGWLRSLREEAFERFSNAGFPTTRDEDWRFTNVSAIARTPFRLARKGGFAISERELEPYRLRESACQLVFVNGYYAPTLSRTGDLGGGLPAGLEVSSLAAQIARDPESVKRYLGRYLNARLDAFSALNTAFLEDGAYVRIRRGAVIEQPIAFLYISTGGEFPVMSHPRNLFIAERESHAALSEDYISMGDGAAFSNAITELVAGDGAVISHYMIERESRESFNVSTLRIEQGRATNVTSHSILLGGGLVRNNVHPVLAGEGAECLINGLFIGSGRQHLDNYMLVEHSSPRCASRQFYNGILQERAHGVFHGRIIVHKDAQKTDAKQTNRNLLLSDDARIDTKPQLEIYADDVKCTHGATIGQIDEAALFYLRARGIGEATARKMLLYAFAVECLDRMKHPCVRALIADLIRGELAHLVQPGVSAGGEQENGHRSWEEIG